MKVAMLMRDDPDTTVGGIPTYSAELTRSLRSLGVETEWVVGGSDLNTVNLGSKIRGCDLVHAMSLPYGAKVRMPMVATCHSPLAEEARYYSPIKRLKGRLARRYEDQTVARAGSIIAVSKFTEAVLLREYHAAKSRIVVIPHGVDGEKFKPAEKVGSKPPRILICSRLDPRKNISEGLKALSEVRSPYHLDVIGDGPERTRLEGMANALGTDARFLSRVPQQELMQSFARAEIFLSTSYSEGFGLSLLQAMSSGAAPLVSDIAAHRELVEHMKDGMVYSTKDELARYLDLLLADEGLASRLGKAARDKALTYTWERVADATADLYARLLEGSDRAKTPE